MTTEYAASLDVRRIPPRSRHPLIFGIFHSLPAGEALLISNDHDPRPLHSQFQAEADGEFSWDYLQQGPDLWQVRIGKLSQVATPQVGGSCCGGGCGGGA